MKAFLRVSLLLLIVFAILFVGVMQVHAQDGDPPDPDATPVPEDGDDGIGGLPPDERGDSSTGTEPTEEPPPVGTVSVITSVVKSITNRIFFPTDVFTAALFEIFKGAAASEERGVQKMLSVFTDTFYQLIRPLPEGYFKELSAKSMPIAAGLAVPFFILRLAIYHWNGLIGNKDDLLATVGDWLTAGILVIVVGPGLDLVVKLAWWMVRVAMGEPADLAISYISYLQGVSLVHSFVPGASFMRAIVITAIWVTAILAVASLGLAFLSGSVALFLLAYIGPPLMVIGVIPQTRWLRTMWLQGVVLVCLLPVAAGAIFTVGIEITRTLPGYNLITILFRVLFLFGASGFLFSLSGFLGKLTIGAASDVLKGMVKAGKAVIDSAVMAGAIVATGGAATPAAAGAAGAGAAGASAGAGSTGAGAGASGLNGAIGSLKTAEGMTKAGNIASAFGMDKTASFLRGNAAVHQLQARQAELAARAASFGAPPQPAGSTSGYGQRADAAIGRVFNGPNANALFQQGFNGLRGAAGSDGREMLNNWMKSGTDDMMADVARMASAFNAHQDEITASDRPLWEAANLGGVSPDTLNFLDQMYGGNS